MKMRKQRVGQRVLWCVSAVFAVLAALLRPISGMRFSAALCLCVGLYVALFALMDAFSGEHIMAGICKWLLLVAFVAGLGFFCFLEAQIVSGSRSDAAKRDVSCVIVLGAGVDGMQPSLTLKSRLDAALSYLADKPDIPVIVSGSQGRNELISEAECMERYLTAHGLDASRIWKEEQATSTRTNLLYSRALMAERSVETTLPFAVVTSNYHAARTKCIALNAGIMPEKMLVVSASLPNGVYYTALTVNYYIREAFALANEMLLEWDLDL
ncbi:MAG: YdcF family protein [Oscillospiraceae bacterium]|nr:YdcF family protein [Oscillospiraceae bacterium]